MFTDDQFKRILEILDIRELVIRIDENTKNMRVDLGEHKLDDAAINSLHRASLEKVHSRVDDNDRSLGRIETTMKVGWLATCAFMSVVVFLVNLWFNNHR